MLQSTALRYSSQRAQTGNQQPPAAKRGSSHIQKAVADCADPFVPLRPLKIWENLRFCTKKSSDVQLTLQMFSCGGGDWGEDSLYLIMLHSDFL